MAVNIPISANASAVVAAFAQIQQAIDRAGQAGRDFNKLDLSHPELRGFAADIRTVQQRLDDLTRLGRGQAAAAVRSFAGPGGAGVNLFNPGGLLSGGLQARYPNQQTANSVLAQAGRYVFQGTQFQPQTAPPPPPQPPPPPPPPGLGGGLAGLAGPSAMSFIGPVLGMVGVGALGAMAARALQSAQQQGIAVDTLMRRINDAGTDFDSLRKGISDATRGLGLTNIEATRLATTWSRLTGDTSPDAINAGMRAGAGFGRSYGLEPGQGVAMMGRAQMLGEDPQRFALMLGEAMQRGGQTGQMDQVSASFMRALEAASARIVDSAGIRGTIEGFGGLYTAMNEGGARLGLPGLRGVNAENIIGTMNNAVMAGGNAGMAGQILTMRAFQAQGITNPYEAEGIRERGMFATVRPGGPTVLQTVMGEVGREYGGVDQFRFRHIIEQYFGLKQPQTEALQKVFGDDLQKVSAGGATMGQTWARLQGAGIDPTMAGLNPTAMQSLVNIAAGNNLGAYKDEILSRTGKGALSADEARDLRAAGPADLQTMLLRLFSEHGGMETEGSKTRDAMTNLQNRLTDLGEKLVPPITALTVAVAQLVDDIQPIVDWFSDTKVPDSVSPTAGGIAAGAGSWLRQTLGGIAGRFSGAPSGPLENITDTQIGQRVQESIDFFQSPAGGSFTHAQAVGITQGAMSESTMGRNSQNIFQWTDKPRIRSIESHFGKKISEMSFREQLAAHAWELNEGPESAAGAKIRTASTAYDAAYNDSLYDERPAAGMFAAWDRGRRASRLDHQFPEGASGGGPQPVARVEVGPLVVMHINSENQEIGRQWLPTFVIPPTPHNAPPPNSTAPAPATPTRTPRILLPEPPSPPTGMQPLQHVPGIDPNNYEPML